jgi:hypothetical protein
MSYLKNTKTVLCSNPNRQYLKKYQKIKKFKTWQRMNCECVRSSDTSVENIYFHFSTPKMSTLSIDKTH